MSQQTAQTANKELDIELVQHLCSWPIKDIMDSYDLSIDAPFGYLLNAYLDDVTKESD